MVAGTVGALRAPQREQARPLPKANTREPYNGRGGRRGAGSTAARASPSSEAVETFPHAFLVATDGLARPRSQRPYRDHGIAATHGIPATPGIAATPALPTPPIWRDSQ